LCPAFAFSDGYRLSVTALGESTKHNAPSLINVSKLNNFDWANPKINTLEKQMHRPLFSINPIELGTDKKFKELKQYFKKTKPYNSLITKAFGNIDTLKIEKIIINAIASYLKTLNSNNSKFDKYLAGELKINSSEKNGMGLFFSNKLGCKNCHKLPNFTNTEMNISNTYFNNGLYNLKNQNKYPENDNGIIQFTNMQEDNGKFKIPSLRNVMLTSPYMHDGSVASLGEVLDIYAAGGRNITKGINFGDGRKNELKSKLIKGFVLNNQEKIDLLNFLQTLTDSTIFKNPKFQNPFQN
jgi:cytochrome c peroxidase